MSSSPLLARSVVRASSALLLMVVPSACRSATETPPAPATAAETEPDLAYTIARASPTQVRIELAFKGCDAGFTELATNGGWGGVQSSGIDLADVSVRDARGEPRRVEHREAHRWFVHHEPSEPLIVSYVLPENDNQASTDHSTNYRPMVGADLFHTIGEHGLLAPVYMTDATERRIQLEWQGFQSAACSFGAGGGPLEVATSVESFRHAVFLAGDVRVLSRDVRGRPLYVAIAGDEWQFTDDAFADLAARIVEAQRAFFDDFDYPYFLISLVPVGVADPNSRSLGGTALSQSFALFLQPDTRIESTSGKGLDVAGLLAHEMFHHWNGRVVTIEQPEQRMYWFSEGFTNFFARRLLHRLGLMDGAGYATSINEALTAYELSPVRDASNDRVVEGFWTDRAIGELPYQRGDLAATWLDGEIRRATNGSRSLDDFLRVLVRKARAGEPPLNAERCFREVSEWIGSEASARFARMVEGLEPITFDADRFEPCLEWKTESKGAFDLGFDLERSRAEKKICGLRAGCAAEQAGLAEGQALRGLSIAFGRADVPVELRVEDRGVERTITYLPHGELRAVQQFVARESASDCSML